MLLYDDRTVYALEDIQPDMQLYQHLKDTLHGTWPFLIQSARYLQDAFMIKDTKTKEMFQLFAIQGFNHAEILASYMHQLHGIDDNYYEDGFDPCPQYQSIKSLGKQDIEPTTKKEFDDLSRCILFHIAEEEKNLQIFETLKTMHPSSKHHALCDFFIAGKEDLIRNLKRMLKQIGSVDGFQDFGIMPDSQKTFSYDSGNYFDPSSPTFLK